MKRSFIIPTLLTLLLPVQIINADVQSQNSVLRQHSIEIEGLINNDIRKADSLVKAGKPDEALTYYKSSLKSKDSLYNLITNSQMEEILSLYNMDKLILQREQRRSMFHQACLYISVIIILALLLTNIHIYRSRKRLQMEANMMKFQLQNCNVQEWCNELPYLVQMRSEGYIHLELQADVDNAIIYTDVSRFTQIISSMLLYPVECKKPRRIGMQLVYNQEKQEINFRIDNSPLADSAFASQKEAILQKINLLFFEHFNGSYRVENCENNPIIFFTYPALIT